MLFLDSFQKLQEFFTVSTVDIDNGVRIVLELTIQDPKTISIFDSRYFVIDNKTFVQDAFRYKYYSLNGDFPQCVQFLKMWHKNQDPEVLKQAYFYGIKPIFEPDGNVYFVPIESVLKH